MAPKVDNNELLMAGLEMMKRIGKPLTKIASNGRSMLYKMQNGETVRVRTCNDHLLIVLSSKHSGDDAQLNIEGTDWLLIVMPEIERTPGMMVGYLVPTSVAVDASRQSHASWLAGNPNTKGDNKTWNLRFDDGSSAHVGFGKKWKQYILPMISTPIQPGLPAGSAEAGGTVKTEVEAARIRISQIAGVPVEAVKITIEFGF